MDMKIRRPGRPRPGRPLIGETRKVSLTLRHEDWKEFEKRLKISGMSKSQYLRFLLEDNLRKKS